ncbi:MAG TPA: hypothetical protein VKP64_15285 [Mycobacteriales bacterium]|nr:hypothetical protein [Mycobacteriales bacterium]
MNPDPGLAALDGRVVKVLATEDGQPVIYDDLLVVLGAPIPEDEDGEDW